MNERKLAHIYNSDFSKKLNDFMPIKEVDKFLDGARAKLMNWPGNIMVVSKTKFYYIPYPFRDNIYIYSKQDSIGWVQEVKKGMNTQDPFTRIDEDSERGADSEISIASRNNTLRFLFHNQSRGLVRYNDLIFHFTLTDINDRRYFGAEIYDKNLNPIGYTPIKSIPITYDGEGDFLDWFVQDVDEEGNFYIMERYSEGSRVRVLQVDDEDLSNLTD